MFDVELLALQKFHASMFDGKLLAQDFTDAPMFDAKLLALQKCPMLWCSMSNS